jgi:hypothetical protein
LEVGLANQSAPPPQKKNGPLVSHNCSVFSSGSTFCFDVVVVVRVIVEVAIIQSNVNGPLLAPPGPSCRLLLDPPKVQRSGERLTCW